MRDYGAPLFS